MNNFTYKRAESIEDALAQNSSGGNSSYLAGGTNLVDLMKYDLTRPDTLVDLNRVDGHHEIYETPEGGLLLGAFVTNADTAWHPSVEERYPLLSKAILAGASAQIRNMATNGGNLLQRTRCYYFYDANVPCNKREPGSGCSAIPGYNRIMAILGTSESCIAVFPSDMCVGLAALDATVHVEGPTGSRSIPFADFHRLPGDTPEIDNTLLPGEIITGIELPANGFSKNYSYLKLRDRNSYAFALVSVATGLELDGNVIREARIALGGVAHKPWRVREAEEFLAGKTADSVHFGQAAEIILRGAVGFPHNAFKIELAKRAIVRNCMMALNPESQLPGAQPSV
ncbi:xanthine dehydrogenase family protein subunit M [Dyadobacter sp. CY343]|uniref:FAD binding domain-containing protein n=1 Tax=Dyadobacter sp. CY343 TaxID=2907299 RepID=UPI001F291C7B|nr:xanthine dehydrogenase family protein subunit M [Dyadobacter sp. CY343]MCE7060607.1 xanthine dehydrogenase family protein subunit M [Dyadobacter sp. CY343]